MTKPTVQSIKSELDTHEAVCAERWKETILRIKRIERIMIGTAGATILLLVSLLTRSIQHDSRNFLEVENPTKIDDGYHDFDELESC